MDTHLIRKFERIGARAKIARPLPRWNRAPLEFSIDIGHDRHGEFFDLRVPENALLELDIVDVQPNLRHLLLLARQDGNKDKFLCGHDERHWFTCAVPGVSVSSVQTAMEALKPAVIVTSDAYRDLNRRERQRRRNAVFLRQGEWFFVPQPDLVVPERLVLQREPLSRGGGSKSHWLEEAYRCGGDTVYVSAHHPTGLLEREYHELIAKKPKAKGWNWNRMTRDAAVYARGSVSHADHATISLRGWHRVFMNTESQARAARNVAFLD
ncbi:MAG: hypothetical protein HC933_20245 [Pleurocapsa sp. SU_196_0]|nr:hypothetical protein [Pleurocapsa sp. SU_196_0]